MSLPPGNDLDEEEISLRPYLQTLWRYRRVIVMATVAAVVIFGVTTLGMLAFSPPDRLASLNFASRLRTSTRDAIRMAARSIPRRSRRNLLSPRCLRPMHWIGYVALEELRRSLSVVKSSPAVRRLDAEFQAESQQQQADPRGPRPARGQLPYKPRGDSGSSVRTAAPSKWPADQYSGAAHREAPVRHPRNLGNAGGNKDRRRQSRISTASRAACSPGRPTRARTT